MNKFNCLLLLLFPILLSAQVNTSEFANPPKAYHPTPLWFWNNTSVDAEVLQTQLRQMVLKDRYGGCSILPFGSNFRPEYLSADYFSTYGSVIEEAVRLGVSLSLYDEYGFPSGSMGAINADGIPRFMNKYPDETLKRLDKVEYVASSGTLFRQKLPEGKLMSIVAIDTVTLRRVSLKKQIQEGEVIWKVPAGA